MCVYRPSSNPPQTAWARHLDKVMRENSWSRVILFEKVGAELGYGPKSRSALLPLLVDKDPTDAQAAVLRRHFGEPAAEMQDPAGAKESGDPLIAALNAQTAAISALVAELALSRAAQVEATAVAFQALGSLAGAPALRGTPRDTERESHAGTGR